MNSNQLQWELKRRVERQVWGQVRDQVWEQARWRVSRQIDQQVWSQLLRSIYLELKEQLADE